MMKFPSKDPKPSSLITEPAHISGSPIIEREPVNCLALSCLNFALAKRSASASDVQRLFKT